MATRTIARPSRSLKRVIFGLGKIIVLAYQRGLFEDGPTRTYRVVDLDKSTIQSSGSLDADVMVDVLSDVVKYDGPLVAVCPVNSGIAATMMPSTTRTPSQREQSD